MNRRAFCFFLTSSVLFGLLPGASLPRSSRSSSAKIEGSFLYPSHLRPGITRYPYRYDERWFQVTGYTYQHGLAQMSLRLAMAAAETKPACIAYLLAALSFQDIQTSYPDSSAANSIGYVFGRKTIPGDRNTPCTLIVIGIRGGGYGSEWGGNFLVGTDGEHEGFSLAARQVLNDLRAYLRSHTSFGTTKIWVTGYSRAAATANLVARALDDGAIPTVQGSNLYAYTFECPQTVSRNAVPSYAAPAYDNIFNLINPIDLVTKAAPSVWGFTRYGKSLYFPCSETSVNYAHIQQAVFSEYSKLYRTATGLKIPMVSAVLSSPGTAQATAVDRIATQLAFGMGGGSMDAADSRAYYVKNYQRRVSSALEGLHSENPRSIFFGILSALGTPPRGSLSLSDLTFYTASSTALGGITAYFDRILSAHLPELALAWVDALNGPEDFVTPHTRHIRVNGPVDVQVYDSSNLLAAEIRSSTPHSTPGYTVSPYVDRSGQKSFLLPISESYRLKLTALESGTLSYQVEEYDLGQSQSLRLVNYFDVPLQEGDSLFGSVENLAAGLTPSYALARSDRTTIQPDADDCADRIRHFSLTLSVQGTGNVSGSGLFVFGEYAMATATATPSTTFLGWYQNHTLLSTSPKYRLRMTENITLTAVFRGNRSSCQLSFQSGNIHVLPPLQDTPGTLIDLSPYIPTQQGSVFSGWFRDKALTQPVTDLMLADDTTIYAKWDDPVPTLPFTDVGQNTWFADDVIYVYRTGLMSGVSGSAFAPHLSTTRGMLATILYVLEGQPPASPSDFSDVDPNAWYADAIAWASASGIVSGYGEAFLPNDPITREQFAAILFRYSRQKGLSTTRRADLSRFKDRDQISPEAEEALSWASASGLIKGTSDHILAPRDKVSRAQAAAIFHRFCKLYL